MLWVIPVGFIGLGLLGQGLMAIGVIPETPETKPATEAYVNNFDHIFKKGSTLKRYRIPVDIILYTDDIKECEEYIKWELRDMQYELPVGYPVEEDTIDT